MRILSEARRGEARRGEARRGDDYPDLQATQQDTDMGFLEQYILKDKTRIEILSATAPGCCNRNEATEKH